MLLIFTKTKMIQFGERALKVPLVAIPGSPLCPVSAYQQMVSTIPAPDTAAAFSHVVAGELKPYTYSKFQKKLKSAITAIGKDPRLYSSHSMRRGGATSAFEAGVQTSVIQTQGDWATDTYLRYVRMPHIGLTWPNPWLIMFRIQRAANKIILLQFRWESGPAGRHSVPPSHSAVYTSEFLVVVGIICTQLAVGCETRV